MFQGSKGIPSNFLILSTIWLISGTHLYCNLSSPEPYIRREEWTVFRRNCSIQNKNEMSKVIRFYSHLATIYLLLFAISHRIYYALKEVVSQINQYLVSLSSKTYVFEDNMTKY